MNDKDIELILNSNEILTTRQQYYILLGDEFLNTVNIRRNVFPDAVLEFVSAENHVLTAKSSAGLGQGISVIAYEFNFEDTDDLDFYERKRYSKVIIGNKVFESFTPDLVYAFLKHKTATLIPINDQHARDLVKVFYKVNELGDIVADSEDYTQYNY